MTRTRATGMLVRALPALVALSFVAPAPAAAQSPEWTAIVNVRPDPTPYIADWENDPLIVTLVLSYTGSAGVTFHLQGSILRGATPVVGGRSTTFEFVRQSQLILTTRDGIWERNGVTYEPVLRDQIERTGRIPDGEYQFCVDVRQGLPQAPGGLLARDCAPFSITAPQPPSLIALADGDTARVPYPTFVWTPVALGSNTRPSYHLRIAPVLPGQSPLDALNNVPHFEADLATTALSYPASALPLEDSTRYVWQVQALDAAGQPVGERQGKSEVWTFVFQRQGTSLASRDSSGGDSESAASRFSWGGIEVKVLSVRDSSRDNYSGTGRVKIVPGLFEPSFDFHSVRLDSSGTQVRYAPRHVISIADGAGTVDWALPALGATPFLLSLRELVLVADSGGDQFVGASGDALLHLGLGTTDSSAHPAPAAAAWTCTDPLTGPVAPQLTVCGTAIDGRAGSDTTAAMGAQQMLGSLGAGSLVFRFDSLRVGSSGPQGTIRLAHDFATGIYGLGDARLTVFAESTTLDLAGGDGHLDLNGAFRLPTGAGLRRDQSDTPRADGSFANGASGDTAMVLAFRGAALDRDGGLTIGASGLPMAHVGQTGLRISSAVAVIDLSNSASPAGRDPSWRGVHLDAMRMMLPAAWHSDSAGANAGIAGHNLGIDVTGLDGEILAAQPQPLAALGFGGFPGWVDSVRVVFQAGALDAGHVAGRLRLPFLEDDVPYAADLTPDGVQRAYTQIDPQQRLSMPAFGGDFRIERGEITTGAPDGLATLDGQLTVEYQNVHADVPMYGMTITPAGKLAMAGGSGGGGGGQPDTSGSGWIAFSDETQKWLFKKFPVKPDSIGWGTGATGDEVWLGFAGHFALNANLPFAAGTFRAFARRDGPGSPWRFSHFNVDEMDVVFMNAAVTFRGIVSWVQDDSIFGSAFSADVSIYIKNSFSVFGKLIVGATDGANSFRYWYVDGRLLLPPPGIGMGPLPLSIWGFAGGVYSKMTAQIDSTTLAARYVPDENTAFGLKAAISLGTQADVGFGWNADLWLEAEVNTSGGLQSLTLRGNAWMLTEVTRRYATRVWGTVLINLPVSQDLLHAQLRMNVLVPAYFSGTGWAELHFEPGDWFVNIGTPAQPDSFMIMPGALEIPGTAHFHFDAREIVAGLEAHLEQERQNGNFKGRVAAGFEAGMRMRYRPFQASGEGELWGEIVAKVRAFGDWYEILSGTARATLNFRFPDPAGIWGRVKLRYRLLGGSVRGTYRMRYKWGDTPDAGESDSAQFVIVAASYPAAGDTAAPLTGMTWYLGMSEGFEYGMDDGVYRMRLSGTPTLQRRVVVQRTGRDRAGNQRSVPTVTWQSIGTVVRDWQDDRATLVIKAPGHATLLPSSDYRAQATFVLEKQNGSSWDVIQTVDSSLDFRTTGQPPLLAAMITATDPAGASPMYFGGPDAGAVRVQFSNTHPDLTSGAVTGVLVANASDTVAGIWGTSAPYRHASPKGTDPTLYSFMPAAGALAPSTAYRFAVVSTDTSRREHRAVSFTTSLYATLADHVAASMQSASTDRGFGPSGSGDYLLKATVILAGPEPMSWNDIDSIEVVGLSSWTVTPRTRCQAPPSTMQAAALGSNRTRLCGEKPVYENVFDIEFVGTTDAELPAGPTNALTLRLNHIREGWRTFTFTLPTLMSQAAAGVTTSANIPTTQSPTRSIDVTGIRP